MTGITTSFKRRFFQIISLFLLCICLCFIGILTERQKTLKANPSLYPTMDQDGIFHIYNTKDFDAFLQYVQDVDKDLDAVLDADVAIGNRHRWVQYYAGHFDGQGHTVSGLSHELFLLLEKTGLVENLTVDVDIEPYEGADTGGLIYYNCGTVRNCEVHGQVTGCNYVGGIAAISVGLIQDCRNYAFVTSLEDGQTMEYTHWTDGYGAGGIAGLCATSRSERKIPDICAITDCHNYGDITGQSYAGGIVARLDDRTEDQAPASSVQELVENFDFVTPSEQTSPSNTDRHTANNTANNAMDGRILQKHYSLAGCRNYGTVTVKNRQDPRTLWPTQAAGICADLSWGNLYECANLGKVCFDENAPKYSESGYVYTNCPMAIAYNMGFAPTEEHHIVNCVNLKGTIAETMRHENIMELSKEELLAWENGNYQEEYISNSWEFDLQTAVDICGLQPLAIRENPLLPKAVSTEKNNYYLCDAFSVYLPEYLQIEEVFLSEKDSADIYALHITAKQSSGTTAKSGSSTFMSDDVSSSYILNGRLTLQNSAEEFADMECWIVRKDADVPAALKEAKESNTRDEWRVRYFLDELFGTVSPYYYMDICSLNLPFHDSFRAQYLEGRRIFMEGSIPDTSLSGYLQEGDHVLGNMIAMPLEGRPETGIRARWMMVFTTKGTNVRPSRAFINLVESGFYPFDGTEETHIVSAGESLWQLADTYTLRPKNWEMLAHINGMDEPGYLLPGTILIVPSREEWEKDAFVLSSPMIKQYG